MSANAESENRALDVSELEIVSASWPPAIEQQSVESYSACNFGSDAILVQLFKQTALIGSCRKRHVSLANSSLRRSNPPH